MKLEIDPVCEAKIRRYQEIIDHGNVEDDGIYKELCEAALLVAGSVGAKLSSHDMHKRMGLENE